MKRHILPQSSLSALIAMTTITSAIAAETPAPITGESPIKTQKIL